MSGCVDMGLSALLFPGARDAVKTALLLLLLSKSMWLFVRTRTNSMWAIRPDPDK